MAEATMLEAMRSSNVATYAIHTGDFSPALLRRVANASGGSVASAEQADTAVRQIVQQLDHYYILGFRPRDPDRDQTTFRPLDVRVRRDGATVQSRRGYRMASPKPARAHRDPLIALSQGVLPKTDLPLRLLAVPLLVNGKPTVALALEATIEASAMRTAGGSLQDDLDVTVIAVDERRKKVVARTTRRARVRLEINPSWESAANVVRYQVIHSMRLAPGRYQLRVSARSARGQAGGSVYGTVEIPQTSQPQLGSLLLGLRHHRPLSAGSAEPFPFAPVLDRTFDRDEELRVVAEVFGTRPPDTGFTLEVFDDADRSIRRIDGPEPPDTPSRLDMRLPLTGLAPGAYRLVATARSGTTTSDRQVRFTVR
jgi:hypothetical protein